MAGPIGIGASIPGRLAPGMAVTQPRASLPEPIFTALGGMAQPVAMAAMPIGFAWAKTGSGMSSFCGWLVPGGPW